MTVLHIDELIKIVRKDLLNQQQNIILDQLNGLITKDLLLVEQTEPVLVMDGATNKITLQQSIKLVLRDKSYIETLETENKLLKDRLNKIQEIFNG